MTTITRAHARDSEQVTVRLDTGWNSWAGLHGGYLSALAADAACTRVPDQALRSVQTVFLRPVVGQAATITVENLRAGRTTTVLDAVITDDSGRSVLALRALLGAASSGPQYLEQSAPVTPAPEDCPPLLIPTDILPFAQRLDIRSVGPTRPLAGGDTAELLAWIRLRHRELTGPQTPLVLVDALPPALYASSTALVPIPSADLAVHLGPDASHADPDSWFLVQQATMAAGDGWSTDRATVWAPDGTPLATATQTRRVLNSG